MTAKSISQDNEQRRYKRLDSYVRVDFSTVSLQDSLVGIDWQQGHTRNLSEGGLCLDTDMINESVFKYLNSEVVDLKLKIYVPYQGNPVVCVSNVAWFKEIKPGKFRIGVEFKSLPKEDLKKLTAFVLGTNTFINLAMYSSAAIFLLAILYACLKHFN